MRNSSIGIALSLRHTVPAGSGDTFTLNTATQTLTNKTLTAPDINAGTADSLTSMSIRSTGAAYDLLIATSAVYTANRTLTINIPTTANAALTLTGDLIRSGAHSLTLTTTAATDVTLPTTGTLATLAGTETLTAKTLTSPTINGTVATTGLTMPAFTMGGILNANTKDLTNVASISLSAVGGIFRTVDNSYFPIYGGSDSNGAYLLLYGKSATPPGEFRFLTPDAALSGVLRLKITGGADTALAAWASTYHTGMKFGLAGTATGAWTMDGATSGVVTMTVAAAAGTWTMTLPTGAGSAGSFLESNGSGVTSWNTKLLHTAGAFAFQEATTISTTAGDLTLNPAGVIVTSKNISIADAANIVLAATTGTKIGTATTQKLGFYNATPIVQGASVADATGGTTIDAEARTAINALISRIEALGLIATV